MSRAANTSTTHAADAGLVAACRAFVSAAAELDAYSSTGLGDGAAVLQCYYSALATLTRALPQSAGAVTGKAIACHLARPAVRRLVPHEARAEVAALMAGAQP